VAATSTATGAAMGRRIAGRLVVMTAQCTRPAGIE
jgi:hypothetical protein